MRLIIIKCVRLDEVKNAKDSIGDVIVKNMIFEMSANIECGAKITRERSRSQSSCCSACESIGVHLPNVYYH